MTYLHSLKMGGRKRNTFLLLGHPLESSSSSSLSSSTSSLSSIRELFPNVLLEPTPIDPTGMVIVRNIPLESSLLCKDVVDESFLALLSNLHEESHDSSFWSETPVLITPQPPPPPPTLVLGPVDDDLEQSRGRKLVDISSTSAREDLAWWSDDCIEELRKMNDVVSSNHSDNYESHATASNARSLMDCSNNKGLPRRSSSSQVMVIPCCSPEPSNDTVTSQKNRSSSPLTSVVVSTEKKETRKNHHSTRAFRMHQSNQWYKGYLDMVDFREKYGHCLVPLNWPPNPSLAHWVSRTIESE
jgi:hypothetical protein